MVRSEKETVLDGLAQEEVIKSELSGIKAEKIEAAPVTGEADTEPQLPEIPMKARADTILNEAF